MIVPWPILYKESAAMQMAGKPGLNAKTEVSMQFAPPVRCRL